MNDHAIDLRISALAVHFREIGETRMRDLPFYNARLSVEACGFAPFDQTDLIGVLVTPWFMNLMLLPLQPAAADPQAIGQSRVVALPGGARRFLYGGDLGIGGYWAHSLHSPMQKFASQGHACSEARAALAQALAAEQAAPRVGSPGRRAFLGGRRAAGPAAALPGKA